MIHLEHEVYCAAAGDCQCGRQTVKVRVFDPEKAKSVVSEQNRRFPKTITLLAPGTKGSSIEGLHVAAEKCADVQRLLGTRQLQVRKVESADPPQAVEDVTPPAGGEAGGAPETAMLPPAESTSGVAEQTPLVPAPEPGAAAPETVPARPKPRRGESGPATQAPVGPPTSG